MAMIFEEIYARFRRPVWRLARRMTDCDDDALDATQEIFVRVWRGMAGFRGEAKISTWVFQIAWNYLRLQRRQRVRRSLEVGAVNPEGERVHPDPVDVRADPERLAITGGLLARVEGAIALLPEHQRVVLWLRDGEDLSYEEIARVLDLPIGTVRSRLARARGALRRLVEVGHG